MLGFLLTDQRCEIGGTLSAIALTPALMRRLDSATNGCILHGDRSELSAPPHWKSSMMLTTRYLPAGLLALVCAACATNAPYVRLVDVEPRIGTRVTPDTTIRVQAAYRLPDGKRYQANLMFLTQSGSVVSASGTAPVWLTEREGVVTLQARPAGARSPLESPLTAVVMIMSEPRGAADADTTDGAQDVPAELRERIEQIRDSLEAKGERVQFRTVASVVPVRPIMRSRAIFYNAAGPASLSLGPALPFEEVITEYRTYGGEKAIALAVAENGRRTWGYAFGFRTTKLATERALLECEQRVARRGLQATCELYAVGDSIPSR